MFTNLAIKGVGWLIIKKVDLNKIKSLRKKLKISIEEMSRRLGYSSPNGYYYLEIGRSKFTAETLALVAQILGTTIDELFFEERVTELAK